MISRHLIVKFYLWILVALTVSVAVAAGTVMVLSDHDHDAERNFSSWMLSEARIGRDIVANLLAGGVSPEQLRTAINPLARHSRFSITASVIVPLNGKLSPMARPKGSVP